MTDKQPALIIYNDGSIEQLIPLQLTFFEEVTRLLAAQTAQLKQQVMIQPPSAPQPTEEEQE